jgi:hypothetical protein
MRAVDALLVLVLLTAWIAGFVALARRLGSRRTPRWRVGVHTRDDGTMVVQLERDGEPPRTLRELPPGLDAVEFESDLRIAVEDAEAQAAALNRR